FILFIFFTAFTLLEACLPSWVSKVAPIRAKGSAMGIYSTSQFLGIFIGGSLGGIIMAHAGYGGIFLFCAVIAGIWLLIATTMSPPPYLSTVILELNKLKQEANATSQALNKTAGVAEVALMPNESLLYLKIDKQLISEAQIRQQYCL
nr:MFS transporter [Gammaproteobacteria bacterium]